MKVVIAGHDRLGILMADSLSKAEHDVLIVEAEGNHLRSFPSDLASRSNVRLLEGQPTLDETMVSIDIRGADIFVAALRTPAENGLAALKAKLTYGVENVIAIVTNDALCQIYERFGIHTVNPYTVALTDLNEAVDDALASNPALGASIR